MKQRRAAVPVVMSARFPIRPPGETVVGDIFQDRRDELEPGEQVGS